VAGYLYAQVGALTYVAMAAIAMISLTAALRLIQIWNGRELVARSAI
jgi:PPP family 3-phenylpropionic acid transporter